MRAGINRSVVAGIVGAMVLAGACSSGPAQDSRSPRDDPDEVVLAEALDFRPLHVELGGSATAPDPATTDPTTDATEIDPDVEPSSIEPASAVNTANTRPSAPAGPGRIVDDRGREVILRGANLNSLGDYFAADSSLAPVVPVKDSDWAAMAANGFNVVRLLVSWSRLQPTAPSSPGGGLDQAYVEEIRLAIKAAADHGIGTVVDLHQDAWGKYIASSPDTACPDGKEPAIGWDGAPEWATVLTAAAAPEDTCRVKGARELSSAVQAAFSAFYRDTAVDGAGGLRTNLALLWGKLAHELGAERGLVGYDLFNEPNMTLPAAEQEQTYTAFVVDSIRAIREAEGDAGHHQSLIFVEPVVLYPLPGTLPTPARILELNDSGLVFAPHNYAEVIGPKILSVEQTMDFDRQGATQLGAALWVGEHGIWDTGAESLAKATRFATALDKERAGSAWWQWRQACGDPHSVATFGHVPDGQTHLNAVSCPDGETEPTEEFLRIAGRAFPRAAPGTITEFVSDTETGAFSLSASRAPRGTQLVVWVRRGKLGFVSPPESKGLRDVRLVSVSGGWVLVATVDATTYSLNLARGAGE